MTGTEPVPANPDSEPVQRYTAGQSPKTADPAVEADEQKTVPDQQRTGVPDENPVQAVPVSRASTQSDDEDAEYDQALDNLLAEFNPVEIIRGAMPWAHIRGGDAA